MADGPILIVDNEKSVRDLLRKILEQAGGYAVVETAAGPEVLRLLSRGAYGVVLVGMHWPDPEEGLTLLQEIRHSGLPIPILMIGEHQDADSVLKAIKAGAQEILFIPFEVREVLEKVAPYCIGVSLAEEEQVVAYVRQHFSQLPTRARQQVAQALGLCPETVSRQVLAATGLPFNQFLQHLRIEESRRLLETTELTIAEIAHQVGFSPRSAPSLFSRLFRRAMRQTPRQYRLAVRTRWSLSSRDEKNSKICGHESRM